MRTLGLFTLVVLIVAGCDAWIVSTAPLLPARVVTKWTNGIATNFMTRNEWISAAVIMVSAVGLLLASVAALARRFPRLLRVGSPALRPQAQAWADARFEVGFFALAALHTLWMSWFHWIIVQANLTQPPQLNAYSLVVWIAAQLTVVFLFVMYLIYITVRARRWSP